MKQIGTVLFSNIVNQPVFQGSPTGKYELTITLDPSEAADAEANGLAITRSEYQGTEQVKAKLKTKFRLNEKSCVDRMKRPYVDDMNQLKEIPRGSKVAVFYTTKPYEMMGRTGVTNYLLAVQVIDENSGIEFDDYEDPDTYDMDPDSEF